MTAITTKVGLCRSLRNLHWYVNLDVNSFYPRCYDLNDLDHMEDFINDFKLSKAESIMKQYLKKINNDEEIKETFYHLA